jgi:hypothetical protein
MKEMIQEGEELTGSDSLKREWMVENEARIFKLE